MSPELVGAFERQWPDIAGRLQGLLANKNVPSCKRDDVVQETGLRLFGMWERVDRNRPVWPLAVTIALNLIRDEARRNPQREVLGAVPEVPAVQDVEHEGLARIELERVQQAMAHLSPPHREVLMKEITPHEDVPKLARNATKMMRLRARRALTTLLETAVIRAGVMGLKVRQSLGMNDPMLPLQMGTSESGAIPATALAIAAMVLGTIQVQPETVANASEKPPASVRMWSETTGAGAATDPGDLAGNDLRVARAAMLAASDDALAADVVRRGKHGKPGHAKGKKGKRAKRPHWGTPPPSESSPLEVPLPIGSVHAGVSIGYGVLGVQIGERQGSSTPVCLSGIEPAGLGCGTAPPQKARVRTGAEVEANGRKVEASVDEEVGTNIS